MITINLLPGAAKRKLRQELIKILSMAFTLFGLTLIGLGIVFSIVLSEYHYVDLQIQQTNAEVAEREKEIAQYDNIVSETTLLKDKLSVVNEILEGNNRWALFLTDLAASTPSQGVVFNSITMAETFTLSISGVTDSSYHLAVLLEAMEDAYRPLTRSVNSANELQRLASELDLTVEEIQQANNVGTPELLLEKESIIVPQKLFEQVEVGQVNLQPAVGGEPEVERDVAFSLQITLNEEAIR